MSEPKLISPLLDGFVIGGAISEHHGVRCYPAMNNHSDTRYILKVISIPASQVQLDALLLTGAYSCTEAAQEYFHQLAQGVVDEAGILARLSKLEGFLAYEGCQVEPKEDGTGYDVYLLSPYKRSLERHFRKYPMTHLAAVNLGLDMCAALAVCRQSGYLCADLKPGNIFISDDNEYRIGDLGFINITSLKYASLPDRYRSQYTAPELADPFAPISTSMDIYAAGLVLYQAYNGGLLPFEGQTPAEPLPPPLYADYEMSEIILKACALDPEQRWEDPIKMGQALVSYMQRNGVNDTPIVPPPATYPEEEEPAPVDEFEEEPAEDTDDGLLYEQADAAGQMMIEQMLDYDSVMSPPTETEIPLETVEVEPPSVSDAADDPADDPEDPANLTFMNFLVSDETAPHEEMADQIDYAEVSEDACDILEQADDLIAHETPAPAVAPEPIEVPLPPPIVVEPEIIETVEVPPESDTAASAVDEAVAAISQAVESNQVESEPVLIGDIPMAQIEASQSDQIADYDAIVPEQADNAPPVKKNWGNRILAGLLALILLACIAVAGYIFYRDYYMKTIEDMQLSGEADQLTVSISTKADQDLLTIVCTDHHGIKLSAPVENGCATFSDLKPDTLYTISVEIDGFHGLKGDVKTTYTTAPQTEIMSFNPVTGAEPGSVILTFTTKGHNSQEWKITYEAEGEEPKTVQFTGTMTTITGLTIGKTYTLTLDSVKNTHVIGQKQIQYHATDLIYPENLNVTSFTEEGIVVTWDTPKNTPVEQWTVICNNDSGYNQSMTTSENTATFTQVDPAGSYTIEVTAAGMSVGSRFYLSKNTVTVGTITATPNISYMDVSWDFTGPAPGGNWLLTYTVDGSTVENNVTTEGTKARIENIVPNSTYTLKLQLDDATTVLGGITTVQVPPAEPFDGYGVNANSMRFSMCVPPSTTGWEWQDVTKYTDTFSPSSPAGFVVRLFVRYGISQDVINTLFVIRDSNNAIVSFASSSQTWSNMWFQFYGELTIPAIPQTPGQYSIEVYFNGQSVHQQNFTVAEN